jgi:hypothetical protein
MKKFSILFAVLALVLASLACQTLSGGGRSDSPELSPPSNDGGAEPTPMDGGSNSGGGGSSSVETEFPLPDGAMNVQDLGGTTNFQVKMTLDEAMKFYMDALTKEGYTERSLLTVTSDTTFSMVFDGHESGKAIVVQGVDMGDGTVNVNIRLEDV